MARTEDRCEDDNADHERDPPISLFVLRDTRLAWVWVAARVYLGYAWIDGGVSILGGASRLVRPDPSAPMTTLTADVVQIAPNVRTLLGSSELIIGLLLLIGALTGLTAFISIVLSVNALWPGPAASDPIAFASTMLLIVSWRTAGWYGLDHWLLREPTTTQTTPTGDLAKRKR